MSSGGAPLLHGDAAAAAPVAVAAVNSSSSQVGGTASSGASLALLPTKLSAAGAPALPRVNESSEPPLAPSPSSRLLSRGASVTDDGTAHNAVVGAPSHVRAAAEPTVAASVAAAPRTPPRRHPPSREDGVVPGDEEEEGRGRVHVVLMNASRQTFGRFASGSSERQVNDDRDDNDGTGGSALHRCTGGATTMSVPSPQRRRVVWSRLAAREPCAHGGSDGAPWPTTTTRVSAPGGGGGGGGRGGRGRGTMQHAAPASQSAQFAKHTLTPATETVEQRATADSSLGVSDDREKDKEDPLHAHRRRRCRSSHVDFAGMEVSASSTSSIPHSMAETQWVNTSEAMELDAQDLPLPLPSTAGADDFTTVSASTASPTWSRAASPLLTCAKVVGEAGAASGAAAKPRSSIAVPATIVPHRRGTAGPQQLSGNQSEWRRKRSDDESAALSGRNSYSVSASRSSGGAGDTPLVSVERSVTWSGARRTEDSVSSPLASPELKPKLQQQQQRQRRSMDSSELVPSSPPQAAANGAQSTVDLSSAACNPSGSYVSLRSMGSHNGAQRAVPLSRACPPRRAVAPPLQLPTPLGPGDGGAAGANLGVSVRSPLGMSNSVGLPMFMSGSTASLMAFPRYDAATPPRTAHNTAAAPPVRNDVDPPLAPGSRAQQRDSEVERPPLPPTVPSAQAPPSPVAAVLQRSSSIAAASARHGSSRGSPFTPSPSQSQQRQLSPSSRFPRPGEANPFEIGSLNSLSAMPQRSQRTFTVTSAASLGVDNGANAFGSRSRAAAHSSLHDSAISMWQSSTMLSDHILQTLAHGMALGGVSTAPWNAALENATSLPPNSPAHDGAVRRLAAKALPPQSPGAQPWPRSGAGGGSAAHAMRAVVAPSSASSQSVTSTAAGVDRAMHGSPMNQTAHQCGSSLLVPLMHGGGGGGGGPARSLGGWGVAGAPQPQSVAPGQDGSGEAAEAGCYSPTPSIPLAPASASLTPAHSPRHAPRYRASPGAGYFFAAADGSLRDAGGYSATTPPTSLSAALHTERSLVTPMRGYNFARRSTVASVAQPSMMLRPELSTSAPLLAHAGRGNRSTVASSALSQASLGAEGVMFSAGGTPNEVGEAPMVSGAAADDPTRMLRPADSGATHHYATSVADSGVAVAAPTEASLVVPSMFLQSVHDSGAGVAAAPHAPAAPLSMCAAAQRLLAAAVLAGGSGRAGALPPTVPVSLAKIGPMPGLARRLPTGSESTQPSDGTTDTRTSALATAAAVPSGSSEESPNGVSTVAAVSPPPLPHWSAPAASAPMQLPQPRVSLVHRLSDTASGTDTHTSDEPRRCSTAPVTAAPQRQVSGSSDLVAAAATPPLISRIVSIKETGSVRPGEGTTSSFLPVLPLAQEEAAGATSLSCEPTPVVGPMPSGPCPNTPRSPPQQYQQHQQQHQQQQQQQQQWWASAVARAAAPFSGSGNTARAVTSVTTHRNSSSPDDLRSIPPSFGRAPARLTQPQLQPPAQPLLPRPSTLAASPPRDVAELPASDFAGDGRVEPGSQSSTADRAAGTGERYGHSRRANRGMLFHRRSTLTNGSGSRSRQIDDSGSGGGDGGSGGGGGGSGGGAAHRISIPRYQRHHDVESLLDDAERAMNRAAVPIVPVLGLGSRAIEVGEIPFGVLGNGLASSMMSLRTPAMTVSITGSDRGLVSVLAMGSASEKLFSSPSDTAPSFPTSAPTRR